MAMVNKGDWVSWTYRDHRGTLRSLTGVVTSVSASGQSFAWRSDGGQPDFKRGHHMSNRIDDPSIRITKRNPMSFIVGSKNGPKVPTYKGAVKVAKAIANATGRAVPILANPRKSRNVAAGFWNATGFHPLRSSPDYDPDRAGDEYGSRSDNEGLKYTRSEFKAAERKALKKKAGRKAPKAPKKKAKTKAKRK